MDISEIEVKGKKIVLPKFYSKYADEYFYYQKKILTDFDDKENYCFTFFKSKDKADENLPILFCHIDKNGNMVMPVDLMKVYKKIGKMYFIQEGIGSFSVTTKLDENQTDKQMGLTSNDDDVLSIFFS